MSTREINIVATRESAVASSQNFDYFSQGQNSLRTLVWAKRLSLVVAWGLFPKPLVTVVELDSVSAQRLPSQINHQDQDG